MLAPVSGHADAGAVDGGALRVVLALAAVLAVLAVGVEGTGARARLAGPAGLARALARPRVAQLSVRVVALADLSKIRHLSFCLNVPGDL